MQRRQPTLPGQYGGRLPTLPPGRTLLQIESTPQRPRRTLVRRHHQPSARKGLNNLQGQRGGLRHIRLLYASPERKTALEPLPHGCLEEQTKWRRVCVGHLSGAGRVLRCHHQVPGAETVTDPKVDSGYQLTVAIVAKVGRL